MIRLILNLVILLAAAPVSAQTYAIVVGHNGVPPQSAETLEPLRYADDDAARWAQFFGRFATRVHLLTVLDAETQRANPGLAGSATVPTISSFQRAVADVSQRAAADIEAGREPTVFFVYSGHGAHTPAGQPFLTLQGADHLGRSELYQTIGAIPARTTHVVVDACHAAAIVGAKGGFFGRETEAEHIDTAEVLEELATPPDLTELPHVGVLLSASAGETSHEWSEIESGVFTHEILSALHGPADVNSDQLIEYSEVAAYVGAANRKVSDPRAIPTVVVRPPAMNARAPLVSVSLLGRAVVGDADSFDRFTLENKAGRRVVQGFLSGPREVRIAIPREVSYLLVGGREAVVPEGTEDVTLASLVLGKPTRAARGSIEDAYRRGLFAAPFTGPYYLGFVDSAGMIAVDIAPIAPPVQEAIQVREVQATPTSRPVWPAIAAWSLAAVALGAGAYSSIEAHRSRLDFESTDLQRDAHEAKARHRGHRNRAIGFYTASGVTGLAGVLLFPWRRAAVGPQIGPDGGAAVRFRMHF